MAPPPATKPNVAPTKDSPSPGQEEIVPKKPPPPFQPSPEARTPKPPPAKAARLDTGADDLSAFKVARPPAKPEGSETAKGPPKLWTPSLRDPEIPLRANRWNYDRSLHDGQSLQT
eukprot:5831341-Pyramimonas_sp.AAC.1